LPRAGGGRHARGAGGGGVHQQPRGGEAAGVRGLPDEGRVGAGPRHRPVRAGPQRADHVLERHPRRSLSPRRPSRSRIMTPPHANLLTVLGLGALMATVTLTAPRWSRWLREPLAAGREDGGPGAPEGLAAASAPGPEGARRISVRLYFEA